MSYTADHIDELNVLNLFNLSNHQEGIAAAQRLHEKGLITQTDGGYLTSLGLDAAEHAQALLMILAPD